MEENAAMIQVGQVDKYTSHSVSDHPHIRMLNVLGDTHEDYGQVDCEKMALASNSDGPQLEDTHTEFAHFDLEGPWRLNESL